MVTESPHIIALKARRAELTQEMLDIEDQLDDPAPKDWEDRAVERQGDEVLEALGTHDLDEVRRIDAALNRAKAGTYGDCVRCGGRISEERLTALPETPHCRTCAAELFG